MPESMQAPGSNDSDDKKPQILIIFTDSLIVTNSWSLLPSSLLGQVEREDSEACRLGCDSKNVPIGNLEAEKLHERRKSRLKITRLHSP